MPVGTCGCPQGEPTLCWYKSFPPSLPHTKCGCQKQQPPPAWILPIGLALALCALSSEMHQLQAIYADLWTILGTQRVHCCSATVPLLLVFWTGLGQVLMLLVWDREGAYINLALWHRARVITYWNPVDEIWSRWMQNNAAEEKRFKREGLFP